MVGLSPPPHKHPGHIERREMEGKEEVGGVHEGGVYSSEEGGGPLRLPLAGCNCPLCRGAYPTAKKGRG